MSVEIVLIILSSLVIFSYLFDLSARHFKIPSVILLLLTGISIHYGTDYFQISTPDFNGLLPLLGTLGLILIVLEGSLELKLEPSKKLMIRQSLVAALVILLTTTLAIALLFLFLFDASFMLCMINATPLGIISSAIAIPSARVLPAERREFIIYESSFSDIFGIVLFNFLISNESINAMAFVKLGLDTVLVVVLSLVFCVFLLYVLKRINHHIKFFLIIAVLILLYSVGKYFHLSSLVIILAFGLLLSNLHRIKLPVFIKIFHYEAFQADLQQMIQLTGESAFIIRTFFFLIFGFTLDINTLNDFEVLRNGTIVVVLIYVIRGLYQRFFNPSATITELLLSPRGLISILLFFSIPEKFILPGVTNGLIFFVILTSSVAMTVGLMRIPQSKEKAA